MAVVSVFVRRTSYLVHPYTKYHILHAIYQIPSHTPQFYTTNLIPKSEVRD